MMRIHNKRELQNIATNHSEDIDYKFYENLQKEHKQAIFVLTIDTKLPADDPLHCRGNFLDSL